MNREGHEGRVEKTVGRTCGRSGEIDAVADLSLGRSSNRVVMSGCKHKKDICPAAEGLGRNQREIAKDFKCSFFGLTIRKISRQRMDSRKWAKEEPANGNVELEGSYQKTDLKYPDNVLVEGGTVATSEL